MKNRLDLLESRLKSIIEGLFPLAKSDLRSRLARQLVEAMQSELIAAEDGRLEAPCMYTLVLNVPWQASAAEYMDALAAGLEQAAREADIHFPGPVVLTPASDPDLLPNETRVQARWDLPGKTLGVTAVFEPNTTPTRGKPNGSAFLIVDGNHVFALREAVINIGRRPDNHLVVDDPRISRVHAQIRLNRGQFILFDLNSTGGTLVNGQRVRQHALQPGDVISLAGVPIIYGEEIPSLEDTGPVERTRVMKTPTRPPADSNGSTP